MAGRFVVSGLLLVCVLQAVHGHVCIHDEVQQLPVRLSLGGQSREREKRQSSREPIRITTHQITERIDGSLPQTILQNGGSLDRAMEFLSQSLSVDRVSGSFLITPNYQCSGVLTGLCAADGECTCPVGDVDVHDVECGIVGTVPREHVDVVYGCDVSTNQCTEASNSGTGEGLADTDTVIYILAEQTDRCNNSESTLAYASACIVESSTGRPIAGYVNLCPSNINAVLLNNLNRYMIRVLAHEVLHALGFSDDLFSYYDTTPVLGSENYKGVSQRAVVTPEVMQEARDYYDCADLNGLFFEAGSSHWESRILVPELMAPLLYESHSVLSRFTLQLLEASGWYEANYTVAEQTVLGESIPLLYGKGLGCNFIREDCTNSSNFPYACDIQRSVNTPYCSFDGVYKSVCIVYAFTDGCTIPHPLTDADCRDGAISLRDASVEVAGPESMCFMTTLTTTGEPLAEATSTCLETQPVNDGTTNYYGIETANDDIVSINDLRYVCDSDREVLSGVSPENGTIICNEICDVIAYQEQNILQPADYCHSSCATCDLAGNSSSCRTCSDTTLVILNNSPPGPCVLPDYTVQLVGGASSSEGRVEVIKSGQYNTICLDNWDQNLANVVCRQLGFTLLAEEAFLNFGAVFGQGTGPILEEELTCTGTESVVVHCSRAAADIGGCNHSRDASVRCSDNCTFASYESEGVCVQSCAEGLIADVDPRECRNTTVSDFTSEGFTVNATKYEAVHLADSNGMFPSGTEVLRVKTILGGLDDTLLVLGATINDDLEKYWSFDTNFNTTQPLIMRSRRDVPPGEHRIEIRVFYIDILGGSQEVSALVRDAEIRIRPQAEPCTNDTCQNNGVCSNIVINNQLTFSCTCSAGYTGFMCETDIDDCAPDPCLNEGTCMDMVNGYICMCPDEWEGDKCENDVDECLPATDPCMNGGTCNNLIGSYNCTCPAEWEGTNCQDDVDECLPETDPCLNEGICTNLEGSYNCTCTPQWEGNNCENDVDECLPATDPCMNGGNCTNTPGSYSCDCPDEWTGDNCEEDVDECLDFPCQNRGNCTNTFGGYFCECEDGWRGLNCDTDIDECLEDDPCVFGNCTNHPGDYVCHCVEGWNCKDCDCDVDECSFDINPCFNGGTCNNLVGTFNCTCTVSWRGPTCEVDVDECMQEPTPCANNGVCTNTEGSYNCTCVEGWEGMNCTEDIDECANDPNLCVNGGTCNNFPGSYNCTCPTGWEGDNCEDDVNECLPGLDPCQNGGTCNNFPGSYNCTCPTGWEGDNCENDVDECLPETDPCLNGGTCMNFPGSYNCTCNVGFSGRDCEEDIRDPCEETPCKNGVCRRLNGTHYVCMCDSGYTGLTGCTMIDDCLDADCGNGTCVDELNGYYCRCNAGFTGETCMTLIDLCDSDPCQNNATCESGFLSYTCRCPPGYSGTNCENDVDPCSPDPCQNGGDCITVDESNFFCMCPPPYTGETCTVEIDYCAGVTCLNGGTCYVEAFTPRCNCTEEYYGSECEFFDFCLAGPCENEGECFNEETGYICVCPTQYTGENCSIAVDPCMRDPGPCVNGNCSSPSAGEFTCACHPGYTGTTCSEDIMECIDDPCVNGNCTDFLGGYSCACDLDWTGRHCDVRINPCIPNNPCLNNGTCEDGVGPMGYSCDCSSVDFEGDFCESRIDDCRPDPCRNNATCVDGVRDYTCMCPPGLRGKNCTEDIMECTDSPCVYGTCREAFGSFECVCLPGFSGTLCENDLPFCFPGVCSNGGQCIEGFGTNFSCNCTEGFVGPRCTIQDCTGNPCVNGECIFVSGSSANFTCMCDEGYTGYLCDSDINECEESNTVCGPGVCNNTFGGFFCECPSNRIGEFCEIRVDFCNGVDCTNGTCMNETDGYVCVCSPGYTGMNCRISINECIVNGITCSGNGVCRDLLNAYECICDLGYYGIHCENNYTICADEPCHANNTARCIDNPEDRSYTCVCQDGFTGEECDQDIDHCLVTTCLNNGTCMDGLTQATCNCIPGFTGEFCQININDCAGDPCENGGTCEDGINSYMCTCAFGYNGTNCMNYILSGLCELLSPCANGGICMDTAEYYECNCVGDYTGQNCTVRIEDCTPNNPCQNGGTCVDEIVSYSCICPPGYTGMDCEQFGGEPTNCTGDSECGSGYFCMLDCPVDNYPPHVAFLSSPLTLRGQSSMFVPSSRYPAYSGGDFTVVARFRQDPNDDGYLLYYSVDAQTHTFGIFLNASMNVLKILYTPVGETVHRFKTIDLSIPINDNAYHTLAVTVNSKITGYHVETITDGSYSGGFDNDISIDTSPRVANRDPVFIVGSRLPLPGRYRFVGRITQVAFFDTTLTLEEVNAVRTTFNELNGVVGECKPYLEENEGCPVPRVSSSSLCETTLNRCNPAMRCLPDAQGYFGCRSAPIECTSGDVCDDNLYTDGAVCGELEFPSYGSNFFERSDSRLAGMLDYLQKSPIAFDYETPPRVIPIEEHPNVTTDLTIFALVDQASGNDGYVVAKGINSRTRDYSLYLKSSGPSVWLTYRTTDGSAENLVFTNITVSGMGPTTVAGIVDSENRRAELFVNGSSVFKKNLTKTPEFRPTDHMLWVGGRPDVDAYKFRGTIQDLFVANVALSYDVIESMSRQALTGNFDTPSISHYCFPRVEKGRYCRINSASDNSFQCALNTRCVAVSTATPPPLQPPYDSLGTLGTCQDLPV